MLSFGTPASRPHAAARGLIAIVLGAVFLIWPGITIGTAVLLFAIWCISDALAQLSRGFGAGGGAGKGLWAVAVAVVDVTAAAVAVAEPGITAGVLVIVIGIWAIVAGGAELGAAWRVRGTASGWLSLGGLVSILAGVTLVAWPGIGAVTIAIVFGAYLLAYGVTSLSSVLVGSKRPIRVAA